MGEVVPLLTALLEKSSRQGKHKILIAWQQPETDTNSSQPGGWDKNTKQTVHPSARGQLSPGPFGVTVCQCHHIGHLCTSPALLSYRVMYGIQSYRALGWK